MARRNSWKSLLGMPLALAVPLYLGAGAAFYWLYQYQVSPGGSPGRSAALALLLVGGIIAAVAARSVMDTKYSKKAPVDRESDGGSAKF